MEVIMAFVFAVVFCVGFTLGILALADLMTGDAFTSDAVVLGVLGSQRIKEDKKEREKYP